MTTEVEDRRRRRGGILIALVLAVIAAWLVYLWLDGIEGDSNLVVDQPATTTTATPGTTTTTTPPPVTTTTVAPPVEIGAIEAFLSSGALNPGGELQRLTALFGAAGEPAFGLTRFTDGSVLVLSRLADDDRLDGVVAACSENFVQECDVVGEATASAAAQWLDGVLASLGELGDVPGLGIGVVDGEYTLLGRVASEETKQSIGDAVAAVIEPDLTLVNELEVVDSEVITEGTQTALEDLDLPGITFESGSADITAGGQEILDEAVSVLANAVGVLVEVGGHTDSAGGAASNQRLSQARAESVVAYLVDGGVDPAILSAVGYGEEQPVADNGTPEGREQNRRIEFTVSAA